MTHDPSCHHDACHEQAHHPHHHHHGGFFNEYVLMGIAAVAAVAIGEWREGVAIVVLYVLGEWLQHRAVDRAQRSVQALIALRPDHAHVVEADGQVIAREPDQVAVGTIIEVKPGDRVPLDGQLVAPTGSEAVFNTAALTGEIEPLRLAAGGEVLSGMINMGSEAVRLRTLRPAQDSAVSRILRLVEEAQDRKSPTERFITRFARIYTPVVVLLAILIALTGLLLSRSTIYPALLFLVISCPCALVISIPLAYFAGIGAASRMGVLFKGGNYIDALARVDTVCFDKTGTLTDGSSLKADAPRAVADLHRQGIRTAMLSGDKQEVVESVAQAVGIDEAHARLLPADKAEQVRRWQAEGHRVAFVGDGINDAPVLAISHVGIAMGGVGTDIAIETADVVIQTDQPARVPAAILLCRRVRRIATENIVFAITVKLGVMVIGLLSLATLWMAVFADVGVALLCVLNATRLFHRGKTLG